MIEATTEICPRCGDTVLSSPMLSVDPVRRPIAEGGDTAIPSAMTGYQCGSGPCDWYVVRPEGNRTPLGELLASAVGAGR